MNTSIFTSASLLTLLLSACSTPPTFHPITQVPSGKALVYVYASPEYTMGDFIWHNGEKFGGLGPNKYLVHFVSPGTNSYGFHMNYFSRGGLIGMMLTQSDPTSTVINVQAGKTYYLRLVGQGMGSSLWRVDDETALEEMKHFEPDEVEKPKRIDPKLL